MAHFYADIQGNRGEGTRMGTKDSGISGHIRGWTVGAKVECSHDGGVDMVRVYKTSGSHGSRSELLAEYCSDACKGVTHKNCNQCYNRFKCFTERQ